MFSAQLGRRLGAALLFSAALLCSVHAWAGPPWLGVEIDRDPAGGARVTDILPESPLTLGRVAVGRGDVIVADSDGAIVVPRHLADEVARDSFEQERLEKFVAIRVGQGKPIKGTYPPNDETKKLYQDWIKAGEPAGG